MHLIHYFRMNCFIVVVNALLCNLMFYSKIKLFFIFVDTKCNSEKENSDSQSVSTYMVRLYLGTLDPSDALPLPQQWGAVHLRELSSWWLSGILVTMFCLFILLSGFKKYPGHNIMFVNLNIPSFGELMHKSIHNFIN